MEEGQKVDFIYVVDCIFKNKQNYKLLTDKNKEDTFFMVNRKLCFGNLKNKENIKGANFLSSKFVDKASAMDIWYYYFKTENQIPAWYWTKIEKNKTKKNFTNKEIELFKEYNPDINEKDLDFMFKHFEDEIKQELAILKKFE